MWSRVNSLDDVELDAMNIVSLMCRIPPVFRRHKVIQALMFLFPNSRVQTVRFNGEAEACVDLCDPQPRQLLITRSFEPEFFKIARPFVTNGGAHFDVGANYGLSSTWNDPRAGGAYGGFPSV